jgi:hypothetical protein
MGKWRGALLSAVCVLAAGCEGGPKVVLGDDPIGDTVLGGVGGAGGEGIEAPSQERELHWARGQDGVVRGRLQGTDFNRIVVDDKGGNRHYLRLSPGTVIRRGGEPSSALVLEPGVEVEASFLTWKGTQVVAEVRVLAPPRPAPN